MFYLFSNPSFPLICDTNNLSRSFMTNSLNDTAESIEELKFSNAEELYNYYFPAPSHEKDCLKRNKKWK